MASLGEELRDNHGALVERWYQQWRASSHPHHDVGEAALKNALGSQFRLIGEQLRDLDSAEKPAEIWKVWERLAPELRVSQEIPIEEVVQRVRPRTRRRADLDRGARHPGLLHGVHVLLPSDVRAHRRGGAPLCSAPE